MAVKTLVQVSDYLEKFGYLRTPKIERWGFSALKALAGPDDGETALAHFQQIAAIPVTGELDEATLEAMNRPRCGFPDVGSFTLSGNKWSKTDLAYAYGETSRHMSLSGQKAALREAFDAWSAVTPLRFTETADAHQATIAIRFVQGDHGDGNPFDGPSNVLAHAFFPTTHVLGGDSHFDDAERWTFEFLRTVAAHEFGHALGLAHSQEQASLMWPYFLGPRSVLLGADDVAGIQRLYGPAPAPPPPPAPPEGPTGPVAWNLYNSSYYHDSDHVKVFSSFEEAKARGLRPCTICKPGQ